MRNRGGLALLMVTLAAHAPARAGGDERDPAFVADRLRRAIQKEIPRAKVTTPEPMAMDVEIDGRTVRLGLDNLMRRCAAPPECDAMIGSLVESLKQTSGFGSGNEKLEAKNLRLTLHDREWLDAATRQLGRNASPGTKLVAEPLVADLHVVYVHDLPRGMRLIQERDLKTLGLDAARMKQIARRNLGAQFPALPAMEEVGNLGVWVNSVDEDYAASLLVLPELWAPLAKKLGRPLVVAAPVRNHFLAVGGDAEERIVALRRLAGIIFEEDSHPLTTTLLEWTPTGFRVWSPGSRDGGH